MGLFLNIVVLIFEILYYSLFMKFTRQNGKLLRYIVTFTIMTIIGLIIGTNNLPSYLFIILFILFAMKYYIKLKTSLYDIFIILIMFLLKIIIELPFYIVLNNVFNIYIIGMFYSITKILILYLLKNSLHKVYVILYDKWCHNDFYIRYTFSILVFLYTIISCVFIIFYYM